MRYGYATALFFAAFILQTTFINIISIFDVAPNLILCLVIALSFLYEDHYYGVILGIIFGLFMDICYSQYVGTASLGYLLLGMCVIFVREILNKENIASIIMVTAGGTLAYNIFYWSILAAFGSNYDILYVLKLQPLYIIYNIIIVIILYKAMIKKVIRYHNDRYYR